jgi:hypothetical protein
VALLTGGVVVGNFRVANDSKHIEGVDDPIDEGCTSPAKTAESDEGCGEDLVLLFAKFCVVRLMAAACPSG